MFSQNDVLTFFKLFDGAKEFYGKTEIGELKGDKVEGISSTVHEMPSPALIARHLSGNISIGLSPLKGDDTVSFGAIDIDSYRGDLQRIVKAIYKYDLPICPCYSKSHKLHLYFFFNSAPAEEAVEYMRWYAAAFRCEKTVEVFPKQVRRSSQNKAYSWINLPYFESDSLDNHRKMVREDGSVAPLDEFLERATAHRLSLEFHYEARMRIPCYDAPPCILTSVLLGDVGRGGRNTWLFSAAVYLKLKDENVDLEAELMKLNDNLDEPLDYQELHSTVLASLQRKTYFYQCAQLDNCDKVRCMRLDYGVGSTKSTGLSYGDLIQINTDPPTYQWEVNGQLMSFESEKQLLQQERFRELCLRMLHTVPRKVDDNKWSRIVTKACENMQVKQPVAARGDFSVGSVFYDYMCEFFGEMRQTKILSQIALGRVYVDEERERYLFSSRAFLSFIRDTKSFKEFKTDEIRRRLLDKGAVQVDSSSWAMPMRAIEADKQKKIEIDFDLHEGESNDF